MSMKHIIVGLDGTENAAFHDTFKTNVYNLSLALNYKDKSKKQQLFMYYPGVGTQSSRSLFNSVASAIGDGLDLFVQEAYINLVLNYQEGDKIYIFGFSRGAVAARALTGLISFSGLVKINSPWLIEAAWRNFVDDGFQGTNYEAARVDNVHNDVKIDFLGVWDTVIGPHNEKKIFENFKFKDLKLDRNVKVGVHIVSIDESRKSFKPLLWQHKPDNNNQKQYQIWMPGVHSDIGGGYKHNALSNISLITMIDMLAEHHPEISFDDDYVKDALIGNIVREKIEINDEWAGYPERWIRILRTYKRNIKTDDLIHPVANRLMKLGNVKVRGKDGSYLPADANGIADMMGVAFNPDAGKSYWTQLGW